MKQVSSILHLSATDLSNHLGCKHLTQLNRQVALGQRAKPQWSDPALVVLAKRGSDHEQAYVNFLKLQGRSMVNLNGAGHESTIAAMEKGIEVIVQAELTKENWTGRSDILLKIERPSRLGNWSYEVQDTKLSKNTRAGAILQLALYTDIVQSIQETEPELMHVIKPGDPFDYETYRYADFKAYYRFAKKSLSAFIATADRTTYPDPVEQCGICRWWKECDKQRHDDDHLSLIAGIRSMHIGELQKNEITRLEQFATYKDLSTVSPDRGNKETYFKLHGQAKIQLEGRIQKKLLHEMLAVEAGRGLTRLPSPSGGDIYFDIEGDPFFDQLGLEYLFGYSFENGKGEVEYRKHWAKNRVEEKQAFDLFMNFVMDRLKQFPDLHVYHFSPYEPSTVKRLTLRHSIHESNLDWLLRAERFIDLYAVIKEGLRASVERYSLKDLEHFTKYVRKVDLPTASSARRKVEFALELNDQDSLDEGTLKIVEDYNEDDCVATRFLHLWLEELRAKLVVDGDEITRPELKTGEATEAVEEIEIRARLIFKDLTKNLPVDRDAWNEHDKAKWLLANQLDYFRRELKSAYWEFFRLHELNFDECMDERKAIAGLQYIGDIPLKGRAKLPIHRYRYPLQEIGLTGDETLHEVMGEKIGTVHAISSEECTVDIKKTDESKGRHPVCVHEKDVVTIEPLATAICDIANSILEDGIESMPYRAAKDLLLKRKPRLTADEPGKLLRDNEDIFLGSIRIASSLKNSLLGIQGPPGSGKTHTGAMMILGLASQGKKIGVTAPSHKVIRNLFDKVLELSALHNIRVMLMHKPKEKSEDLPPGLEEAKDNKQALNALSENKIVGGTAWLWASNDAREVLDYLFVDEAGQMSLAHVLAASRAARNIILLGDPQQLEQPQKASHPEGADIAALGHLLDGHKTMPVEKGIFLNTTRRMHPAITSFTSELFYEGRLSSIQELARQNLSGSKIILNAGLFYLPVRHSGNQNKSAEEVEAIERLVKHLVETAVLFIDAQGNERRITRNDIVIVAPYNAQVAALAERMHDCKIGTVDKFQGQEAAIVIYSMTSSTSQDVPRGMNFLYNPNRLNVATSRARVACVLVASDKLSEADCRTVDQMKWTNALCRYKEMAVEITI
jgi:predicted RecB family nuclease